MSSKLRHYFASKMSAMNVPEENIMKYGGWETDYVMKGVYRQNTGKACIIIFGSAEQASVAQLVERLIRNQ